MDILVSYDIATGTPEGERRLSAVSKICEGFGVRVQKSVFECRLDAQALARLLIQLRDAIEPAEDSVLIYRFVGSVTDARQVIGRPMAVSADGPWVI